MDFSPFSRRNALGLLGLVIPGVLATRTVLAEPTKPSTPAVPPSTSTHAAPSALLGLQAGSYRVTGVSEIQNGAFSLSLTNAEGDTFDVEVCARDVMPGAQHGPAQTEHLEMFVKNSGHGEQRTHEGRGLAVMAFAKVLNEHEHLVRIDHLLSLRERQNRFRSELY